jgi:hypothetical protein
MSKRVQNMLDELRSVQVRKQVNKEAIRTYNGKKERPATFPLPDRDYSLFRLDKI